LKALDVVQVPFAIMEGNAFGYANGRTVALNPVGPEPERTLFHELAHILLGHTAEAGVAVDNRTPRNLREVEAEAVAMLCCAALNISGFEHSAGYIQHWMQGNRTIVDEKVAQRIFKTANAVLEAGRQTAAEQAA
jgi:antirestriction protein ArdC